MANSTTAIISDRIVKWVPYNPNDILVSRFTYEDWHKIADDINSDQEWGQLIETNRDFVLCYILLRCDNCNPIAFVYLLKEDDNRKILSIHGGGWDSPILYCRGYILILRYLLNNGYWIRTSVSLDNQPSLKLNQAIGFTTYRKQENKAHMSINLKRLISSRIYPFFFPISS